MLLQEVREVRLCLRRKWNVCDRLEAFWRILEGIKSEYCC